MNKTEVELIHKLIRSEVMAHDCWVSSMNLNMQKSQKNPMIPVQKIDEALKNIEKQRNGINNEIQEILKKLTTQ